MATIKSFSGVSEALRILRTVLGAPDYQRYCEHMRKHHPGEARLGERDFAEQQLAARYERPGSRCC